jgi:N-acetylglucosamine kinase-like BadF-type ATPase
MDQSQKTVLEFARDQKGATEIQRVVDDVLRELGDPNSEAAKRAKKADLERQQLASASVKVTESGQGVDPVSITILVTIAGGVGTHIATKLWDEVVWPHVKRELGGRAVGKRKKKSKKQRES